MTMSLVQPVARDVATVTINVQAFFSQTFTYVSNLVVSVAQTVFSYMQNTVLPFVSNIASQTWTFLRTPAGFITSCGVLGLALAHASSEVDKAEFPLLKDALQIASVASFIGAGVAVGLGVAYGFTAVIVGA